MGANALNYSHGWLEHCFDSWPFFQYLLFFHCLPDPFQASMSFVFAWLFLDYLIILFFFMNLLNSNAIHSFSFLFLLSKKELFCEVIFSLFLLLEFLVNYLNLLYYFIFILFFALTETSTILFSFQQKLYCSIILLAMVQ
jgi:hypothetical protein